MSQSTPTPPPLPNKSPPAKMTRARMDQQVQARYGGILTAVGTVQAFGGYGMAVLSLLSAAATQEELKDNPFVGIALVVAEGAIQRWLVVGSLGVLIAIAGWFVTKR